jgi:hypothetical protein
MRIVCNAVMLLFALAARAEAAATLEGTLYAYDVKTDTPKYIVKHPVEIQCHFSSDGWPTTVPVPWKIRVDVDGKTVQTVDGPKLLHNSIDNYFMDHPKHYEIAVQWVPQTAGAHTARCVLDPDGKLNKFTPTIIKPIPVKSLVVDVAPVLKPVQGSPAMATTGGQSLVTLPTLRMTLSAQPILDCAANADVLRIRGRVTNTGTTPTMFPPGKLLVTAEPNAGLKPGSAVVGNLAPGVAQAIDIRLKPKNLPATLAGATLVIAATLDKDGLVKVATDPSHKLNLSVSFPSGYCNSSPAKPRRP